MSNTKRRIFYVLCIIFFISFTLTAFSHPGRTDSSGGHYDYQNRSGLGGYHYHHGLGPHLHPNGICPYGGNDSSNTTSPSITINNYPSNLKIGESSEIEYSVSNAISQYSYVTSDNPDIVKVNSDNTITAVGEGIAQIEISASGVSKTFTIEVEPIYADEVTITNKIEKLKLGEKFQFEVNIFPENTTNKNIQWSSDNENIAGINNKGYVNSKSSGIVEFTASLNNAEDRVVVEIIEIFPKEINCENTINLTTGEKRKFDIEVLPIDASNKDFSISCEDTKILQYSKPYLYAKDEGETTLHIKTWNGVIKDIPVEIETVHTESIKIIDYTEYILPHIIDKSQRIMLTTEIVPLNSTYRNITWSSSNENIVSSSGDFTINRIGIVTLSCSTDDNVTDSVGILIIDKNATLFTFSVIIICFIIFVILKKKKLY